MNINLLNITSSLCFVDTSYWNFVGISLVDFTILPLYLFIILVISYIHKNKKIESNPIYEYYIPGLFVKLGSGIAVCLIYMYFYTGDTLDYFNSCVAMSNLLEKNYHQYFIVLFNDPKYEYFSFFDQTTFWPETHMMRDDRTFFVVRLISPLATLGFKSFLITTTLLAWISFGGSWRLYRVFCDIYPSLYKRFAIAFLYFPSVLFWGSGIMKDTITYAAAAWFTYSFYMLMFKRRKIIINIIMLLITSWLLIKIKPYIFMSLLPGALIWVSFKRIKKIENVVLRSLVAPFILIFSVVAGFLVINSVKSNLGQFSSFDTMVQKAQVIQQDLKREKQYGDNYYDIGEFDGTMSSLVSKAPIAIISGLFRPFIWEIRNPFGLLAAIENSILLFLVLQSFFRLGLFNNIRIIMNTPILFFSFLFCTIFAFSVGLATANFGALVRYRIPLLPFFLASQIIMVYIYEFEKSGNKIKELIE